MPARIVTATIGSESASACSSEESRSSANTSPGRTRIRGRRRHHPRSSRLISSARVVATGAKLQVVTWQDWIVETAVVIAFPELSRVVDDWRERTSDDRPSIGVPPHVTLLYPFVPAEQVDESVVAELTSAVRSDVGSSRWSSASCDAGRAWPIWRRSRAEPFTRLTEAIVERWPDYPPYEGIHETVDPASDRRVRRRRAAGRGRGRRHAEAADRGARDRGGPARGARAGRALARARPLPTVGLGHCAQEVPLARHALELVCSSLDELDTRAGNEVPHGGRYQHLARLREARHARANVHGDPADALLQKLDLAGVNPGADLEPFLRRGCNDRLRAPDCARRAVERRQEAVTGAIDLLPAVLLDVATHESVVPLQ